MLFDLRTQSTGVKHTQASGQVTITQIVKQLPGTGPSGMIVVKQADPSDGCSEPPLLYFVQFANFVGILARSIFSVQWANTNA